MLSLLLSDTPVVSSFSQFRGPLISLLIITIIIIRRSIVIIILVVVVKNNSADVLSKTSIYYVAGMSAEFCMLTS